MLAHFFFLLDPYSVKRNVARTLNSQLVYEYILHCLRATYKYFALPHKKSAKWSKMPSSNASEEKSQMLTHGKGAIKHGDADLQNLDSTTNTAIVEDCLTENTYMPKEHKIGPSKQCDGSESFTEGELADDISHLGITHEDSDCITEEIISGDNEDFKPSCEETESENEDEEEEEEEQHEQQKRQWNNILAAEQALDEDSDSGELPAIVNEHDAETCSTSDFEGFQHTALTESDEFGLECSGITDDKIDIDEDSSTEGTDELDESPQKFLCSAQSQISQMINTDDEEEAPSLLNQRECITIRAGGELGNRYTGSGDDDALSEEEDDFSIPSKYENKHFKEIVDEPVGINLSQEYLTEKGSHSEDATAVEHSLESELFYQFSKRAFTKGKVSKLYLLIFC